jgi:hypothetical protein
MGSNPRGVETLPQLLPVLEVATERENIRVRLVNGKRRGARNGVNILYLAIFAVI